MNERREKCVWTLDFTQVTGDDTFLFFETECGHNLVCLGDLLTEFDYLLCPYCGGEIGIVVGEREE